MNQEQTINISVQWVKQYSLQRLEELQQERKCFYWEEDGAD
jgi:hypothetical protein